MTQRAVVKLEKEKNERKYSFEMPIGAPYGESYDVLFELLQDVVNMSKEAAEKVKREETQSTEIKEEESAS